jgi:hypothetical protein
VDHALLRVAAHCRRHNPHETNHHHPAQKGSWRLTGDGEKKDCKHVNVFIRNNMSLQMHGHPELKSVVQRTPC